MKIRLPLCQWLRLHLAAVLWAALLLPALAQTSLTNGLVAYYPFNGDANDAAGTNHGTVTGAGLTTNRFGNLNTAYNFSGSAASDSVALTNTALYDAPDYTISVWFNAAAYPGAAGGPTEAMMLFSRGRNDFELHVGAPPFDPRGIRFLPRIINGTTGQAFDVRMPVISTNIWMHLVATYQGATREGHLYLNGQEQTTVYFTGPDSAQPVMPIKIGRRYDDTVPFDGLIDDVRIYNRALSAAEVGQLYASEIVPLTGPPITTQPASQSVVVGQSVTFQVGASGSGPITYQWLKDGVPITGATNATLTLDNVQAAQAGSYVVVVSDPGGSVTSQAATLTFVGAPIITTQPGSRTVTQGSTVNFTVGIATSATLPLRYQWRHNGSDIPGAINPVFTLANAQPSAAGLYSVLVANSFGTNVSAEAALFVSSPPMVVTHPTNQSVTLGSNVTFTVAASGGTPPTYQWRVNGAPIPGANNQSLTITGAQLSSAGIYDVLVSDGTFSVFSSSAVLTVLPPFAITPQPVGMSTNVGGSATFTVGAVGFAPFNGPFTYQWTFNGTPLAGQTTPSLAFTGLALVNSGNYACVVDSPLGSITSSSALLTVFNPFSVGTTSFQPGGLFQMTASGDNGRAYRLESSTNLVIWTAVVTNTVSGGTATFTDSTAAGNVLRFYRIVLLP